MDSAYKIMFYVGVLYTFVSLLITGLSGALHLGGHGHLGSDGHLGGLSHGGDGGGHLHGLHGHTGGDTGGHVGHHHDGGHNVCSDAHGGTSETILSVVSILINPIVAVSFLTVFGGLGILGTEHFKWVAMRVFLTAFASGVVISTLLYKCVALPIYRAEHSTDVSRNDLSGTIGEVESPIFENGFGKLKYTVNDIRYTAPAKHIEGKAVPQGTKVTICKVENSVFYVTEINN
jgi:membrane protein implicated in regulation of membrane protease activity